MKTGYFNIGRDNKYPLFCQACLSGEQPKEISLDPRYCQTCYDFLLGEAKLNKGWSKPDWKPISSLSAQVPQAKIKAIKDTTYAGVPTLIKSTLKEEKSTVDLIGAPTPKRGRKKRELPEELIRQLHNEGMGSKAIASKLKAEQGIGVSYKTVQRVLSGQR